MRRILLSLAGVALLALPVAAYAGAAPSRFTAPPSTGAATAPIRSAAAASARYRRRRSSCRSGEGEAMPEAQTILVVEDEEAIASFVAAYLRKDGFTVRMTASGR